YGQNVRNFISVKVCYNHIKNRCNLGLSGQRKNLERSIPIIFKDRGCKHIHIKSVSILYLRSMQNIVNCSCGIRSIVRKLFLKIRKLAEQQIPSYYRVAMPLNDL